MSNPTKYRFITDCAHGWLEVPRAKVEASGYHPSPYSYHDPKTDMYYLEEDLDILGFLTLARPKENFQDVHENYPSFVQSLRPIHDPEYVSPFVRS